MKTIERRFKVNPLDVGIEFVDYDIITELDTEDMIAGAEISDLCIITMDEDEVDHEYDDRENYLGSVRDTIVPMYRYYYFKEVILNAV